MNSLQVWKELIEYVLFEYAHLIYSDKFSEELKTSARIQHFDALIF